MDQAIYEMPDPPELELGDEMLNNPCTEAEDILKDDFINSKELEDKTLEQIKNEIKDAFDHAAVPSQLDFILWGR